MCTGAYSYHIIVFIFYKYRTHVAVIFRNGGGSIPLKGVVDDIIQIGSPTPDDRSDVRFIVKFVSS
jgi:hypothetical protein